MSRRRTSSSNSSSGGGSSRRLRVEGLKETLYFERPSKPSLWDLLVWTQK